MNLFVILLLSTVACDYSPSFKENHNKIKSRKLLPTRNQTVGGELCLPATAAYFSRFTSHQQLVPADEQTTHSTLPVGNWVWTINSSAANNKTCSTIESSIKTDDNSRGVGSLLASVFVYIVSIVAFLLILLVVIVLSALILWSALLCWQLLGLYLLYHPDVDPFNFIIPKQFSFIIRAIVL